MVKTKLQLTPKLFLKKFNAIKHSLSYRIYFAVYKTFTNVLYIIQKTNTNKIKVYINIFTVIKYKELVEYHVVLSPSTLGELHNVTWFYK